MRFHSFLAILCGFMLLASPLRADDQTLTALTFNVLVEISSGEGIPPWRLRRDEIVTLLKQHDPDLLGIQEPTPRQTTFLKTSLPDYTALHDEKFTDAVLFYKTDRFEKLAEGRWWLSPTPDQPMSKGFGNFLPRILLWVRLKHKPTGKELLFANTHFDNTTPSQTKMAALCQQQFAPLLKDNPPALWLGDFNTDQGRGDYPTLVSNGWKDSYTVSSHASPDGRDDNVSTFPGTAGKRIDHIFYRGALEPTHWEVIHYPDPNRPLSDHYPVLAKFKWKAIAGASQK